MGVRSQGVAEGHAWGGAQRSPPPPPHTRTHITHTLARTPQRQLSKEGLSRVVVDDNAEEQRTFSRDELRALFRWVGRGGWVGGGGGGRASYLPPHQQPICVHVLYKGHIRIVHAYNAIYDAAIDSVDVEFTMAWFDSLRNRFACVQPHV